MSTSSFTLAKRQITHGRVNLPAWGVWWADISIDGEVELSGDVDLVFNDLTLKGTVLAGGPAKGRSDFRIVGGKGGWGKTLPRKSYANDAGVKVSTVIGDAAIEAVETVDATTYPTARLGPAWTRPEGPASRVLEQIAPAGWYIGEDGITRIGARARVDFADKAPRVSPLDKARGTLTLAAENLAKLVPGVVVDGLEAVDVVHEITAKTIRTTIYGKLGGETSRRLEAFRAILDQLDPDRAFRATWEYRVVTLSGNRVDLQPVLVSTGMPDLQRVPVRPGLAGSKSTLTPGSRVLVGFVNASPSRPVVLSFEDPDGEGFLPVLTEIDAETFVKLGAGLLPVVRLGDVATMWPISTTGQLKVLA
jgi:hypothetical protein